MENSEFISHLPICPGRIDRDITGKDRRSNRKQTDQSHQEHNNCSPDWR